ncbi:transmembrane channel-like protein 6b isoform X1 [Denticeps clupeoides]|uniref:Transmembrane channel-like protein n=1 Tax=Denticeps clupeoides TaxID=299321 RepID=A0AAY4EGC6_9TELE|nr:transmembrane channel-like protein 6 isoform X1 [Denticeps clupeoides]XP_028827618.1 transmembrane channel-like protein 6 isoform X1 [Denticeps clupeoides]XP_028827619.1 transmembrane channel-like protein 6 isoform X1 [Denticeps clupeoides]XP_028827620.1 transmembrane channel-like protein 6 isoform X1 [Denticeps clupeoides]XP_028827621.1 transmembrane channel-like protein 6 isoform X1 [Denticeps clupeoides]XP_028827622.1 transmembrane channel-like protein 6 isoform X1 [Denticeps clupeoides]
MARNVNFELHDLRAVLESPVDEDGIHDSFHQLIEEQTLDLSADAEAYELSELEEGEGRDNLGYLASPSSRQQHGEMQEERTEPLMDQQWSTATLRVLSSMPSRTIGRSRGAIISNYYNRTMQLRRRRQSRPSIRDFAPSSRPSIRGYGGVETDAGVDDERKWRQLVINLQNLPVSDRVQMLRCMPLSVDEKREIRRAALEYKGRRSSENQRVPCFSQLKICVIIALRHGWYSWLSLLSFLQLWQIALKKVSGRFGTGVLSYFVFLKTLLLFNFFLSIVTGFFLVLPQAIYPALSYALKFQGLELLTGGGYFTSTVMYYGYYTNSTLKKDCIWQQAISQHSNQTACHSLYYNMPLAYFFTIGFAFFITGIILVYTMSKSFGQSFRIDKSQGVLAMKVFASWDFKVSKKSSIKMQCENISTQIKELLSELALQQNTMGLLQKFGKSCVHLLAWTMCVGSTLACVLAVFYFSDYMHMDQKSRARVNDTANPLVKEAGLLALPVVVSTINLLLPGFFNAVAWMEEYNSPSTSNYVSIFRNLMLKVSVLGVLCYHWLGRIAHDPTSLGLQCWESFVGQELYRFLLMDFIFTMLDTFFGEFLWRLFSQKALKRKRKPVFDIARHVLELIYGQTLAWLGVLFIPVLPIVQIIKLLCMFYMKKASLMMNCQAPRKPWRACQMTTIFITLLCFPSFLGASVFVTYTMWTIKPSESCGPFRGLNSMFQSGKRWVEELEKGNPNLGWLVWAHTYLVENPFFLFVGAGIFLIVIYFHTQVLDGQRKIISLLQEQIKNEGEDKKFLITKLQFIHEQKRPLSSHRIRGASEVGRRTLELPVCC